MANTHEKVFNALKEELVVGPDHHRFQLTRKQRDHFAGQIWEAEDISTAARTQVSLLFLWPVLAAQANVTKKVHRLAQQNRSLTHPHILRTYGYFSWRGLEFLSLEHLNGQTLADLLQKKQAAKLSAKQKQGLLTQLTKALERSPSPHDLLAPDCVFLNTGGGVKLFGFGWRPVIAPLADSLPTKPHYHRYQAPEAFHAHTPAPQNDVYALAVMAWELYSGKTAFQDKDGESTRYQREFKQPSGLDKSQSQTLNQALLPEAEQRPESALALIKALFAEPEQAEEPELDAQALEAEEGEKKPTEETDSDASQPTPEPEAAESTPEPESADTSDTDTAPATDAPAEDDDAEHAEPRKRLSLAFLKPGPAARRWLGLGAAYLFGILTGSWLALMFFGGQLDNVGSQAVAMMKDNRELRAAFESSEQERQRLQQALEAAQAESVKAAAAPVENEDILPADEVRESGQPTPHLTLFQDELMDGSRGPQMVVIPGGQFRMGDLHGQGDDNEYPVHDVQIPVSFALARYEVTFEDYDRFAEATGRDLPEDEDWGRGQRPVVNVSWQDAAAYARWLAEQTGQPYRLPTEAEWEYSARAGTQSVYWWGDEMLDGYAVCDGCDTQWGGKQTAPVGSAKANPWGLHDMSGNVDEWVLDCYQPDYSNAPSDGNAAQITGCNQRVMRGGSWFDIPRLTRPASRYRHPANTSRNSWGFRVALDLNEANSQ
ncbi:SUMF1/EgtB/PvdO family nonheme iron enzyme [Marinobacterium stanieri]|uniref:Formylglycine-generating enzyme, required for sulfatase activity, contains SUMF1/FGE domain n=1 Tax=Marinobacterium stanieri TaxID=49186 RepID=A0A1N6N6T3_9GAMM|nr:SUMF1/EgtB/PvdO family nonheme iron enzyme [Marinobacterium stanieri]SIP87761.1 Formylglycine-generating enzyme, required for sulfatase activity, contains SUMF1/FGE domain [Marinobacterium stanieri]